MNRTIINNHFAKLLKGYQAILITDPETIQYFSGIEAPGIATEMDQATAILHSASETILICPALLASTFTDQGWSHSVMAYADAACPAGALAERIRLGLTNLNIQSLAIEGNALSADLREALEGIKLTDVSEGIADIRAIKSAEEQALIIKAAKLSDRGIAGVMHHIASGRSRSEKYISEDIRAHTLERGLHVGGYDVMSQVASGDNSKHIYPDAPGFHMGRDKTFGAGETVRMEIQGKYFGYRSDVVRTLIMTAADADQLETYEKMVQVRKIACELLKPGAKANEVYAALSAQCDEIGLNAMKELEFGHGIGVSAYEKPILCASDNSEIRENMAIVISIYAKTAAEDIMIIKDTVIIRADGAEIVGWYENWDTPYITAFTF